MNFLFHFFFNYVVVAGAFGQELARENLLVIFLSSTLLDLDHFAYLARNWRKLKFGRRVGPDFHSRMHEMVGLVTFSLLFLLLWLFFGVVSARVAALCVILHLTVDFMTGRMRPFRPFSNEILYLTNWRTKRKILFDLAATAVLGAFFWMLW